MRSVGARKEKPYGKDKESIRYSDNNEYQLPQRRR